MSDHPRKDRFFDMIFGGFRLWRALRGGEWRELPCPDGFWYRVDK